MFAPNMACDKTFCNTSNCFDIAILPIAGELFEKARVRVRKWLPV